MSVLHALFAVALMGMAVAGGIQYIHPGAMARNRIAAQADAGFSMVEGAYRSRQASGAGAPAAASWKEDLFPAFGAPPSEVSGLGWSYGVGAEGAWFCLSGPLTGPLVQPALESLAHRRPAGLYDVTSRCGALGGKPDGSIAATLWMQRATP